MWLAVDSGNTRVKWAVMDGARVLAARAVAKARFTPAALNGLSGAGDVGSAYVAHVGNDDDLRRVQRVLAGRRVLHVKSARRAGGVFNGYTPPAALGVDRWLCLLAARRARGGRGAGVVVVSAGTAVTIDVLSADGVFGGGFILPGLSVMTRALRRATPLPPASAAGAVNFDALPTATAAAMGGGALLAAVGAVLAARRRFAPGALLLLTGGDAPLLAPHLPRAQVAPHLLFHGMACYRGGGRG